MRKLGRAFQIAGGAGVQVVQRHLFGGMAAQRHGDDAEQRGLAQVIIFFGRQTQRVTSGLAAGHNSHQMHIVALGQNIGDHSMTRLVVGHNMAVAGRHLVLFFSGPSARG